MTFMRLKRIGVPRKGLCGRVCKRQHHKKIKG
ncbi:MAG: hypothetical protein BWY40_01128 [bacterium ADurb.Bin270]|nr:MAG: hypothetical protein BWY40_01128 [bacterium ADurb.Bin270]